MMIAVEALVGPLGISFLGFNERTVNVVLVVVAASHLNALNQHRERTLRHLVRSPSTLT